MEHQGGGRKASQTEVFITIITVVYNSEQYLEKTIRSVKDQLCNDYEFLIIDGGSKDRTLEIIEKHNHLINFWLSEPDSGIYDAMNKGIQNATGKYLWFINSGDEIANPDTIQIMKNLAGNADVLYGESNLIDIEGKLLGVRSQMSTRKLPKTLTWKSLQYGMTVSHQSILVRREIAPKYNIVFKCSADIDWVIESLKRSHTIVNCNMVLSKYLIGGFSLKNAKRCWKERFQVLKKHYGLITTIQNHLYIILRFAYYKALSKNNY